MPVTNIFLNESHRDPNQMHWLLNLTILFISVFPLYEQSFDHIFNENLAALRELNTIYKHCHMPGIHALHPAAQTA